MFISARKPLLGLFMNENHVAVERIGKGRILFSMTQHGKALSCHFASDKEGLREIKQAIEEFQIAVKLHREEGDHAMAAKLESIITRLKMRNLDF